MYNNALQNIDNVAIWPVISFVIFFLFFLCLAWGVIRKDRTFIERMKHMPLDKEAASTSDEQISKRK